MIWLIDLFFRTKMTSYTDDKLRQIWKLLPLDQEPTWRNYENYAATILNSLYRKEDEADDACRAVARDIGQIEQQLWPLEMQLERLQKETLYPKYQCRKIACYMCYLPRDFEHIDFILQLTNINKYFTD